MPSGFEGFFTDNYERVVRALTVAFGRPVAEDAAQEAFAKAWRKWNQVSAAERPAAWVYVVAAREAARRSSRDARRRDLESLVAPPGVSAVEATMVDRLAVAGAVAALPARQRLAVVLRFIGGLGVDEVAAAMRCAPGTAKSTLHAALKSLQVAIPADEIERAEEVHHAG